LKFDITRGGPSLKLLAIKETGGTPIAALHDMKFLILFSFIFLSTSAWAITPETQNNNAEWIKNLSIILTDGEGVENLNMAMNRLKELNNNRYDLTPLITNVDFQSHVLNYDFFRVLSMVEAVAKSNIVEAIEILIHRIEIRNPTQWRFDQWTQSDINAIVVIANQQSEVLRKSIFNRATQVLIKKYTKSLSAQYKAGILYALRYVGVGHPGAIKLVKRALNTRSSHGSPGESDIRSAAGTAYVHITPPSDVIKTFNGEGIRLGAREAVRFRLAEALYTYRQGKENEYIGMLKNAAEYDSSERVRLAAQESVDSRSLDEEMLLVADRRASLTPEERLEEDRLLRERIHKILENLDADTLKTDRCSSALEEKNT
jgi:hypothetical protein